MQRALSGKADRSKDVYCFIFVYRGRRRRLGARENIDGKSRRYRRRESPLALAQHDAARPVFCAGCARGDSFSCSPCLCASGFYFFDGCHHNDLRIFRAQGTFLSFRVADISHLVFRPAAAGLAFDAPPPFNRLWIILPGALVIYTGRLYLLPLIT